MKSNYLIKEDIEEIYSFIGTANVKALIGKTILVTGAAGFIGRYLIELMSYINQLHPDNPIKIIAVDNWITQPQEKDNRRNMEDSVIYRDVNINDEFTIEDPVDFIIHAAGIASPFYYAKFPLETIEVATTGTKNLLNLAIQKNVEAFLFFSSSEIYGDPDSNHVPTLETYAGNVSTVGPRACYDESKRLGETYCKVFQSHYGVPTKIVRPFNIYGPGMKKNDYRVMPDFVNRALSNKPLNIHRPGTQTRTFCYSTDALNGFLRALIKGSPGEPYNIGNSHPEITISDLASKLEDILGSPIQKSFVEYPDEYPSDEPMRRCPDLKKSKAHLEYEPQISLEEGLRRSIKWASVQYQ